MTYKDWSWWNCSKLGVLMLKTWKLCKENHVEVWKTTLGSLCFISLSHKLLIFFVKWELNPIFISWEKRNIKLQGYVTNHLSFFWEKPICVYKSCLKTIPKKDDITTPYKGDKQHPHNSCPYHKVGPKNDNEDRWEYKFLAPNEVRW